MKTPLRLPDRPERIAVRPHALLTVIVIFGGLGGGALVKGQPAGALALIPILFVARQRLVADENGLTFVNVFRYHIPWREVRDFETSTSGLSDYVEVRKEDGTRSAPIWATQFGGRAGYSSQQINDIIRRLRAVRASSLGLITDPVASPELESALAAAERGDPAPIDNLLATHQISADEYSEHLHRLAASGRIDLEQLRGRRRQEWDGYEALVQETARHHQTDPVDDYSVGTRRVPSPTQRGPKRALRRLAHSVALLVFLPFSAVPSLLLSSSGPLPADPDPEDIYLKQSVVTYGWLAFAPFVELVCVPIAYLLNRFDGNQGHTIGDKLFVFVAGFCLTGALDALWRYYFVYAARSRYRRAGDVLDPSSTHLLKMARVNDRAWVLQIIVGALLAWQVS